MTSYMMNKQVALEIIYAAIDVINDMRPENEQLPKSPDLVLAGEGGVLDSLALVTLTLAVERKVSAIVGREVNLVTEHFDSEMTDLHTPTALAGLVLRRIAL